MPRVKKTLLIMMIWVLDRDRELVTRLLGMSKADAMLYLRCLAAGQSIKVDDVIILVITLVSNEGGIRDQFFKAYRRG